MAKTILEPVLYLLSGVMIAPGAALAWYFWAVKSVADQQSLFKALMTVLLRMVQAMDWLMFGIAPALIVWLVLAFLAKYRWIGAGGMGLVAVVALIEFVVFYGPVRTISEGCLFSVPLIVGLALNGWIVWEAFART